MGEENVAEMDSLLLSLIEKEIPEGRKALTDSHNNLSALSDYCRENYVNSPDKTKFLDETKTYTSQSLASVAYQIHSLAVNMLQMMDQQAIQLDKMTSDANNISLVVDIHKEKVARREIGLLTSSKNFSRSHKIVAPPQQEKPRKYKREEININSLDRIGHGVKSSRDEPARRQSTSSSSGSLKGTSVSSVHSSSQGSIPSGIHLQGSVYQSVNMPPAERLSQPVRPPMAPVAPYKVKPPPAPTAPAPPPPPPGANIPQHKAPPPPSIPSSVPLAPPLDVPTPDYEDLPPPPSEDIYQTPTNNNPVDDLPPPPPSNFYESTLPSPVDAMPPPPPPTESSVPDVYEEKVIAIYDYQKLREDELELMEGDTIYVIKKNDDGWYEGVKGGMQGLFPGNYVEPA